MDSWTCSGRAAHPSLQRLTKSLSVRPSFRPSVRPPPSVCPSLPTSDPASTAPSAVRWHGARDDMSERETSSTKMIADYEDG